MLGPHPCEWVVKGVKGTHRNLLKYIFVQLPSFSHLVFCVVGDGKETYFWKDHQALGEGMFLFGVLILWRAFLLEVESSKQRHEGDLKEKNRLAKMLESKKVFQERVISLRQEEFSRRRADREEQIRQIIQARKAEREAKRKKIFYVRREEERIRTLLEEEEARKREEAERRKKEEAERKAKLDEIAEKQRQRERELEEKERLRKESLFGGGRSADAPARSDVAPASRPLESGTAAPAAAAAAAPTPGKYVPRFRRTEGSSPNAPPPESDRWGSSRPDTRPDNRPSQPDSWRGDDRRPAFGSSRSSWSSSRVPTRASTDR